MDNYRKEPSFSFNDFKNWMSHQDFDLRKINRLVGSFVESKISAKKLADKIETEEESMIPRLAKEFRKNGGTIIEVHRDDMILIEVDSGKFMLHKYFLKKQEEEY